MLDLSTILIPPDSDSFAQGIKRVHYQVYTWIRSHETHMESLRYQEFGNDLKEEKWSGQFGL